MGKGRPQKYTAQQVIDVISGSAAIKATIATRLDCDRHTVDSYLERYSSVRQAYRNEAEKIDDLAESVVIKSIQEGDTGNAKWWLERRRRDKFAVKQEITASNLNIDLSTLTDKQLERIRNGEDPAIVAVSG